jgi:hypothetical protein
MSDQGKEDKPLVPADLALRQFDTLLRHVGTEETLTWTVCQLFTVANGGLLAFGASRFPKDTQWLSLTPPALISILGLYLSCFWWRSVKRAPGRSERWLRICRELEPVAFGETKVLRDLPERLPHSMLSVARAFVVWWVIALVALAVALGFGIGQRRLSSTQSGEACGANRAASGSGPAPAQPSPSPVAAPGPR